MQAMGSITPITIKSIRITVIVTGNTMARCELVVGLSNELEIVRPVTLDLIAWVVVEVVGWSVVDWVVIAILAVWERIT